MQNKRINESDEVIFKDGKMYLRTIDLNSGEINAYRAVRDGNWVCFGRRQYQIDVFSVILGVDIMQFLEDDAKKD